MKENINTQKMLLRILLVGSAALFAVYVYLIGSITFNIIARKSLENTVASLANRVNQLDLTYMHSLNKIDKNYAQSIGFVDATQNIFVARNPNYVAIR